MKRIVLLLLLSFSIQSFSQSLPERYTKGRDRIFFTVSHPMLIDMPSDYEGEWYSNEYNLQLIMESRFGESIFSIGYGLGYLSSNVHHNMLITSDRFTGEESYSIIPDTTNFLRNKLNMKFIEVPIELRLRPKFKNGYSMRIYAGFKAGYLIGTYARYSDDVFKIDDYRLDDVNQWNYGVYLRLGYRMFSFYGYYGLNPVFTGGELNGESLNRSRQISFGLSISG